MRKTAALFIALGVLTLAAAASAHEEDCHDGIVYDDGTVDNAYGTDFFGARYAMLFDAPAGSVLESACFCFLNNDRASNTLTFDVLVWANDGEAGAPGTLLGQVEGLTAQDASMTFGGAFFVSFDLSAAGIVAPGPVYLGPSWSNEDFPDFFLCGDESAETPQQPVFRNVGPAYADGPPAAFLGIPWPSYKAIGVRAVFSESSALLLSSVADLILPGYEVDVENAFGPTTFVAVRNNSGGLIGFAVEYHGNEVTAEPLRTDLVGLDANETLSYDVRSDLSGLDPDGDGTAEGVAFIRLGESALPAEGDYFRVDTANNFATGERLVRPSDFCARQEVRFADFGSGTELRILLDLPQGPDASSFTYTVYNQAGAVLVDAAEFVTSDHLNVVDVADLVDSTSFGTVAFDFSASRSGWVSARYSAFGKFSVELNAECIEK